MHKVFYSHDLQSALYGVETAFVFRKREYQYNQLLITVQYKNSCCSTMFIKTALVVNIAVINVLNKTNTICDLIDIYLL